MKLILASNNKKKIAELKSILSTLGIDVISQSEAGCDFEVEETGTTFAENAFLKAEAVYKATGIPAIADDSGLCVDCLNGEPGIYSARYTGNHNDSDEDRINFLLNKMKDSEDRTARFKCSICCILEENVKIAVEGTCEGVILKSPVGSGGFGYDPVFKPNAFDCSMAELTSEQKNSISHRGNALREFTTKLEEYLDGNNK